MKDRYGRLINYIRISVTDRCNLRCRYCMPEKIEAVPMKEILSYEEILEVAEQAAAIGINRVKITGGEPLVRRGVERLIGMLKKVPGIEQVTLTTNGVLLEERCKALKAAGIDGINVSLDTTNPVRYRDVTGSDALDAVLRGMNATIAEGIAVKVNAVSIAREDVLSMIDIARDLPVDVRFIEMMPIGMGKNYPGISHSELIPLLRERLDGFEPDDTPHGNGPAVYYRVPGLQGSIGLISAIHGKFCDSCNRIRLTSRGFLKSCLCYDRGVDMKGILRGGLTGEERCAAIRQGLEQCIYEKPEAHQFNRPEGISEEHEMYTIGG